MKLISATRVTSLHRHMRVEGNAEAVRENGGGGATGKGTPTTGARTTGLERGTKPRVGAKAWDVLISEGKLTEEQLQRALEFQRGKPMELGKTLVSLGFIPRQTSRRLRRSGQT